MPDTAPVRPDMLLDPGFEKMVRHLDLASMRASRDTIYIVDAALRLRACNPAWQAFARDNGGRTVLETYGIGSSILAAIPPVLDTYYKNAYNGALAAHRVFNHQYECSSPDCFRRFYQTAYPLPDGSGLVITNHLIEERAHTTAAHEFSARLVNTQGMITQCSHCRKIKDPAAAGESWLWVPAMVKHAPANTTHSLCTPCMDFYYPDI